MTTHCIAASGAVEFMACRAELENLPMLQAGVAALCLRAELDAASCHDLQLIVEEACVNVMRHAYPAGQSGPMTLELRLVPAGKNGESGGRDRSDEHIGNGPRRIVLTLEDQGKPFNPLLLAPADTTTGTDARTLGGLGVHLIRQLSDRQHYQRCTSRGNVLTIEKYLAPAPHSLLEKLHADRHHPT